MIENTSDVAERPASNSSAIGPKNAPNEYATPIERLFLLLGLNCAYGADQAGRLRIGYPKGYGVGSPFRIRAGAARRRRRTHPPSTNHGVTETRRFVAPVSPWLAI